LTTRLNALSNASGLLSVPISRAVSCMRFARSASVRTVFLAGILAEPQVVDEGDGADYGDSTDVDGDGVLKGTPAASLPLDATDAEDAAGGHRG